MYRGWAGFVLLSMAVATPSVLCSESRAGIFWAEPEWRVNVVEPPDSPPYGFFSASARSTDAFVEAFGSAYAENPPGPGGPGGTSLVTFERLFRITTDMPLETEQVSIGVSLHGVLEIQRESSPPIGGAYSASVLAEVRVTNPFQDLTFSHREELFGPMAPTRQPIDLDRLLVGEFLPGIYLISGRLEVGASSFSGPGVGVGDSLLTVTTPGFSPVPEPSSFWLILGGAGFIPAFPRLRGQTAKAS